MQNPLKYSLVLLFFLPTVLSAGHVELRRNIQKMYSAQAFDFVEIKNQYGDIEIENWAESQISVEINIVAFGETETQAEYLLSKIQIDEIKYNNKLTLKTFSPQNNQSYKSSGFSVSYIVKLPASHKLDLHNRFGNIVLGNRKGVVNIWLKNGDLDAGSLLGKSNAISASYGNFNIRNIQSGELSFSYGKLFIKEVGDIRLALEGTNTEIQRARLIQLKALQSRVNIDQVQHLYGSHSSDKFSIQHLQKSLTLKVKYAQMFSVEEVAPDFKKIEINAIYTPVNLELHPDASCRMTAKTQDCKMIYDAPTVSMTIIEEDADCNCDQKTYLGKFGKDYRNGGQILLNCKHEDVKVVQ